MIKKISEGVRYQKLTEEEKKARGILGRLVGVCADFNNPTRNGRKYSEQLWENVFNNPMMQEKIKNKVCYGELGHPEDRAEIDPEKIAVCLSEQPVKNKNGQLEAVFDILDTPNGRILKTLCDYGSTLGVSSRGQGDIITDYDGNETVDPDTYECECWDIVLIPAVEQARLQYVREGLDTKKLKLKKALTEAFNNEDEEGKKVMAETLKDLHIDINEAKEEEVELDITDKEPEVSTDKPEADELSLAEPKDEDEVTSSEEAEETTEEKEEVELDADKLKEITSTIFTEIIDKLTTDENKEEVQALVGKLQGELNLTDEQMGEIGAPVTGDEEADEETTEVESEEDAEGKEDTKDGDEVNESLVTITSDNGVTTVDTELNTVNTEAATVNVTDHKEPEIDTNVIPTDIETPETIENSTEITLPEDDVITDEDKSEEELPLEDVEETNEALDKGSMELIKNLQEAIKSKSNLEAQVKSLQKDLAVSDAKVNELVEENNRYKSSIARLAATAKTNADKNATLNGNVSKLEESLTQKEQIINDQTLRIKRLVATRKESANLNESLNNKANEVKTLNESVTKLQNEIATKNEQVKKLTEDVQKSSTLKESYKKLANQAMNALIEEKATKLGITAVDIKRKLGATYTISDVERVCEELRRYQLNISKLPFSIDRKVSVRVNEKLNRNNIATSDDDDDYVDDNLIRMANIRK